MSTEGLVYTAEHEWVRVDSDGTAVFGITDFAAKALGDIVYVTMPAPGEQLTAGTSCGEVESTKSVSDIYAPVDGAVVERNDALDSAPEIINGDPYGAGWLVRVQMSDPTQAQGLLSAADYARLTEAS